MKYTPYDIIEIFMKTFPEHVSAMQKSDHNTEDGLNPFHTEGTVWTHTMMVFNHARLMGYPMEVLFAALLHDLGKPKARELVFKEERGHYARFNGHEGYSFYMALDVLKAYDKLSRTEVNDIAELVASHSNLYSWKQGASDEEILASAKKMYSGKQRFFDMLVQLVDSDISGRLSPEETAKSSARSLQKFKGMKVQQVVMNGGMKPTVTFLIGPPGSGKSTVAGRFGSLVLSRDDIVMELGGSSDYSENWKNVDQKEVDKIFNDRLQRAFKAGKSFAIDKTNMTKKSRRGILTQVRRSGFYAHAAVVSTSFTEVLKRNAGRDKAVANYVVYNMMKSFTYPTYEEFDFITTI